MQIQFLSAILSCAGSVIITFLSQSNVFHIYFDLTEELIVFVFPFVCSPG